MAGLSLEPRVIEVVRLPPAVDPALDPIPPRLAGVNGLSGNLFATASNSFDTLFPFFADVSIKMSFSDCAKFRASSSFT